MTTRITMPQLGESVVEGTIARWLKREGDRIEKYEPLVEVVTEKVNVEVPSPVAGIITRISVEEGATVAVGTEIAIIEEAVAAAAAASGAVAAQQPAVVGAAASRGTQAMNLAPHVPDAAASHSNGSATHANGPSERRRYTPVVQRMAELYNIDLALLEGTGANGRVTKEDVQRYLDQREAQQRSTPAAPPPAPPSRTPELEAWPQDATMPHESQTAPATETHDRAPAAPFPATAGPGETIMPLTPMRRAIAENMQRSASTIPAAWTMLEVDVTGLVRLRERIKAEFAARHGVDLTYLPFVVQAVTGALREFPLVNAVWGGDHILLKKQVNIGIAISVPDGLLAPVVRDADSLSLLGLARACADLINRGRQNRLTVRDMEGATFTVNNPGTFGSIASQPIIPPGQGGILNVEAIVKRPVVRDDMIAVRSMLNVCLSFDHRILDGREAIGFLQAVRQRLEAWTPDSKVD